MKTETGGLSREAEIVLALNDYIHIRQKVAEMEPIAERFCQCDANNFNTCEPCKGLAQWEAELRRLMELWGDSWAIRLAEAEGKLREIGIIREEGKGYVFDGNS